MNISQLQILAAIVDTGSFTQAGTLLDRTQSGISHSLSALEKELGASLLIREQGKVILTESGEHVLAHAREIIYHFDCILNEAETLVNLESGKIRLGCFPSASRQVLPKILAAFQKKHPKIEAVLFEGTDQEVLEWLDSHVVDIAFAALPQPIFETVPLCADQWLAVLPANHRFSGCSQIRIQDVAHEPFIMSKGGCEAMILQLFKEQGCKPEVNYSIEDMTTLIAMVKEEIGWTIVPEKALPEQLKGVVTIPLVPIVHRRIGLAVPSIKTASPAVQAFIREAEKIYPLPNH